MGVQGVANVQTEVRFLADVIFYDRPEHRPFAVAERCIGGSTGRRQGEDRAPKRFAGLRKTTPTVAY